jgi:hypothetical protein
VLTSVDAKAQTSPSGNGAVQPSRCDQPSNAPARDALNTKPSTVAAMSPA